MTTMTTSKRRWIVAAAVLSALVLLVFARQAGHPDPTLAGCSLLKTWEQTTAPHAPIGKDQRAVSDIESAAGNSQFGDDFCT
jgi:hypothetical protein